MRWQGFAAGLAASIAMTIAACGSSDDSTFNEGGDAGSDAPVSQQGPFAPSTPPSDAGPGNCVPKTCAELKVNCGPVGDGCGGIVQCGNDCPDGETCGGGGTPSVCGKPPCKKKTCAELGVECGAAGDGCGGLIASCGTCDAGICGGGGPSKCGSTGGNTDGGVCVPTKTACGPGDCGFIADGCGKVIDCTANKCPAGQTCGGGGTPDVCGAPPCVKATCGTSNCGFKADGCGGVLNCWPAGGPAVCPPGQTCGGANVANVCGTPAGCTGLCLQQQQCPGGGTTTIEGYVTSPNGVLPIPNAVVYVPNGAVAAFTNGVKCESCATASGNPLVSTTIDANGYFLLPNMPVSTPGKVVDIPVVVQLGRWRKQLTVQTTACTNNLVPAYGTAPASKTAALPSTKAEGDIPLTAISTGAVDGLECVFRKMGVADSEFTDGTGNGRIRLYQDNGAMVTAASPAASVLYGQPLRSGNIDGATNANPIAITTSSNHNLQTGDVVTISGVKGNTNANGTWTITRTGNKTFTLNGRAGNANYSSSNGDTWYSCGTAACNAEIEKYDATIFGCVGSQRSKDPIPRQTVVDYANKGGRVFATHFSYVWLYTANGYTSPWAATATSFAPGTQAWENKSPPGSLSAFVDTSFPKGVLFNNWLKAPVAPTPATYPPPYAPVNALWQTSPPMLAITEPRKDINPTANLATSGIASPAQRWIYATAAGSTVFDPANDPAAEDAPLHYTFNTPWGAPAANQCGRVLFSDFHVSIGNTQDKTFPSECNSDPLTPQEKVLAYMLFDLASCVSTSGPPACVPKTCTQQGIGCGPAGDGCGKQIDCGNCPLGQTCGGGGVPSQCGAPACTPLTCQPGQCGLMGDGCGKQLDCGNCQAGQICGGGGPNMCGTAQCTPTACPAPAPGSVCGPVANGCGGINNCPCPANTPCVNGTCGAPACTPRTCQQAGANCGQIADGCGKILDCGICVAPQTCGGGGTPNVCGGGVN
jgi:hypothetical protein